METIGILSTFTLKSMKDDKKQINAVLTPFLVGALDVHILIFYSLLLFINHF